MCGWCLACRTGVVLNTAKRRLTQTAVFFRRHFLCGALLCNCSSAKREGLSTHDMYSGNVQQNPLCAAASCHTKNHHIYLSPVLAYIFFIAMQIKFYFNIIAHLCTAVLINTRVDAMPAKNYPVFEIVHDESVKVYLHTHVRRECSAEPSLRRILCD